LASHADADTLPEISKPQDRILGTLRTKWSNPETRLITQDIHVPRGQSVMTIDIRPHILIVNGNQLDEADMDFPR
jgi:hypothetical protein